MNLAKLELKDLRAMAFARKGVAPDADLFTPVQPRVNLVPKKSLDRTANTRATRIAAASFAGAVLVMGTWWGSGYVGAHEAETNLVAANATAATLAAELTMYAPVTVIAVQSQSLTDTVASQTAAEVDHAAVITHFLAAADDTMTVQSMQIDTASSTRCVSTDPFAEIPLVGCITFTGTAPGGGAAASLAITALGADPWFADAFIPTVGATGQAGSSLSGTVGLTMDSLATPVAGDESATDAITTGTGS